MFTTFVDNLVYPVDMLIFISLNISPSSEAYQLKIITTSKIFLFFQIINITTQKLTAVERQSTDVWEEK